MKSSIKIALMSLLKETFIDNQKDDIKGLITKKILDDSKLLLLLLFFVILGSFLLLASLISLEVYFLQQLQLSNEHIVLISSLTTLLLSGFSLFFAFKTFKERVEVYKKITEIKKRNTELSFLSPLFDELKREQKKMKRTIVISKN